MYNIAVCDDEPVFLKGITDMIRDIFSGYFIPYTLKVFQNTDELLMEIKNNKSKYHLFILDIIIGNENGIRLAAELRNISDDFNIIFVTSSTEFLLDGYTVQPVGYILKPVIKEKLEKVIMTAYKKFKSKEIVIDTVTSVYTFKAEDLLYIEVFNKTLAVHLNNGKSIELKMALKALARKLPADDFFQCHRSYIVYIPAILSIRRYEIELKNMEKIPISKTYYKSLQEYILDRMSTL